MTRSSTSGTEQTLRGCVRFTKIFGMTALQLPENYRCPPEVVEIANKLIGHNLSRDFSKSAQIANKKGAAFGVIRVESFESFDDEAEWVASNIASLSTSARSECVVLARTRRLLECVREAFGMQRRASLLSHA